VVHSSTGLENHILRLRDDFASLTRGFQRWTKADSRIYPSGQVSQATASRIAGAT